MTDHLAVAAIVFVAALLQVTLVSSLDVLGGTADVLLLSLLALALLRGSVTGGRRLRRRAAGRRDDARHARRDRAALRARRLLGRTVRRDDRAGPGPCAAARRPRHDRRRRRRGLRPPLPARRGRLGAARALETLLPSLGLNLLLGAPIYAACRGILARAAPRRQPRCGSLANPYRAPLPVAAFPAARPAGDRAVPLHAAARAPRRRAAALALAIFAILFLRLWALQVLSGDRYLNAAQDNQLRTVPVEAARGSIVDRSGNTIVSNVPGPRCRSGRPICPTRAVTRCSSACRRSCACRCPPDACARRARTTR